MVASAAGTEGDGTGAPARAAFPVRKAGAADLYLPVLGVGAFSFGGGSYWGAQSQGDVDAVVGRALDLGVNYFDTAEAYNGGESERALGRALAGRRSQALIGSKVQPDHAYADALIRHCDESLRRLGTDYLDLYMLHWPLNAKALSPFTKDPASLQNPPTIQEAMGALDELRRKGKIRHIGISNFGASQMAEAFRTGVPIAVNQLPYNLMMRGIEPEVLGICGRDGIGVLGYMALFQGLLSDKFTTIDEFPPMRTRTRHFRGDRAGARHGEPGIEGPLVAALHQLQAAARRLGVGLADLALWWAAAEPRITCTLVGARNRAQLEANVKAVLLPLDSAEHARLSAITDQVLRLLGPCVDYWQNPDESRSW